MASAATTTHEVCGAGAECAHYKAFGRYEFTEAGYQHLTSSEHPMVPCRYGQACKAHARLRSGSRKFDDVCHCCIFAHGRIDRSSWPEDVVTLKGSLLLGEGVVKTVGDTILYEVPGLTGTSITELSKLLEETQAELVARGEEHIQRELHAHGLEHEMRLLTEVVPTVRRHPRLAQAQAADSEPKRLENALLSSILDIELFALLLYTGTDAQGMIRKALRSPEGSGAETEWYWTVQAIKHAVIKLSEPPPQFLFHGLNGVSIDPSETTRISSSDSFAFGYTNLISTSMSIDMATTFAIGAGGTVASSGVSTVGCVLRFDTTLGINKYERAYADLRWISKFPDEQEWLLVPLSEYSLPGVDTSAEIGFIAHTTEHDGPGGQRVRVNHYHCGYDSHDWEMLAEL